MAWPRRSGGARRLAVARLPRKTAPTATPPTTVPNRNRGRDAWPRAATISTRAARNTPRPASTTRRLLNLDSSSWVTVPTASSRNTTAPWTAWLPWCSTVPRKVGASAENSPSRAKAEKPAAAAAVNSPRPCAGNPSPAKRMAGRRRWRTVSGTRSRHRAAAASTPRYTSNTRVVGCGAYWANNPATSGPRPRPPMFAAVAASDARRLPEAGARSGSGGAPGERGRRGPVPRARRYPGHDPARDQHPHVGGQDEHARAQRAGTESPGEHRLAPRLIRGAPGQQQRGHHRGGVDSEGHRHYGGGEVPLRLVDD